MAITDALSPKPTPASSAWSRLVQLTKNASTKSSQANEAESARPIQQHVPPSVSAVTPARQQIRIRRPIASPSRISINKGRDQGVERDMTLGFSAGEAASIEVCPCPVGDLPLPDDKCSLSKQREFKPKPKSPSSGPTKTVTLSAFWGTRTDERSSTSKSPENNTTEKSPQRNGEKIDNDSCIESRNRTDDERGIHASSKAGSAIVISNQAGIRSLKSQYTSYSSSPSPTSSSVTTAQTTTASSSKDSHFVARPPTSAESNISAFDHEASLGCQTSTMKTFGGSSTFTQLPPRPEIGENITQNHTKYNAKGHNEVAETNTARLTTPSSSQESAASSWPSGNDDESTNTTPTVEFKRKAKRRLTFHSAKYNHSGGGGGGGNSSDGPAPPRKKTKTQPKRKNPVQTTLSLAIGGSAGMRECKVCDTVYNPFHPEDVKVHAKRHAGVLKIRAANNA